MFSPGGPKRLKDQKTLTICYRKKKKKRKVIMEKVQRKTCFCTAAEGKQELYTQQELLAPHSWSSEDHSGEAEPGPGLSVGWAAPVIWPQEADLQKG